MAWHLFFFFFGLSSWNAKEEGLFAYLFFYNSHPPVSARVMKLLNQPMFDVHPPSQHILEESLHMPDGGLC